MTGTAFSGTYGRRSGKPYFDQLPRIAAGDYKHLAPGLLTVIAAGQSYAVRLMRVPSGCMTRPSFICARCGKTCRVLYGLGAASCYRCTPATRRSHSLTPKSRAVLSAKKVFRKHAIALDYKRPEGKPKWMRWPTFEKLSADADAALSVIEANENGLLDAIDNLNNRLEAKLDAPKRKRGRPVKAIVTTNLKGKL